jgi:REP element-mobilizing transposase RayT
MARIGAQRPLSRMARSVCDPRRVPHSHARLHVHLVFATKRRAPFLTDAVRDALHRYLATVLADRRCRVTRIGSAEDHVHVFFELARTAALSDVVEAVKRTSSKWIKTQGPEFADFAWQGGYGAFSVSASQVTAVRAYVARQREHHRRRSFESEYRALLARHGITVPRALPDAAPRALPGAAG